MKRFAVRTLRLCTKDCLCLYVCPTGATDTEDSIIQKDKCIGCGACAAACPSGAISLVPRKMPPQQAKQESVVAALQALIRSKALAEGAAAKEGGRLMDAIARSCRLMGEDLYREAGFMLPQSANARSFLQSLLKEPGVPQETVQMLLDTLPWEEPQEQWRCSVCGYVHQGPLPPDFTCPVCHQPREKFERI